MSRIRIWIAAGIGLLAAWQSAAVMGQALQDRLAVEDPASLVKAARESGDAKRGAILFYQPYMACTKCHTPGADGKLLGPDLPKSTKDAKDVYLVESVLHPSKEIKKGFESVSIFTVEGKTINGLLVEKSPDKIVLRDVAQNGKLIEIKSDEIDEMAELKTSLMPAGQVNQLAGRQQFLDLLRYLIEIRDGGVAMARQLEPAPSLYAARPLPEYEKNIDHAGMLAALNQESFKRGEKIYNRLCINCHGTHNKPGSLPTSLKFASDKFKNGNDPYTMYQTLTRGFGMMVPQAWMVPQQKYDVIHYIRQAYLKEHNSSQFASIDRTYLDRLPKGDTRGPAPTKIEPWVNANYGHSLVNTYEIGSNGSNFAYKGIAVRVDPGPGGVSRGRHWMVFDHDTLRVAAAWSGKGFIDYNGIHFNGRHNIHPRIVGQVQFANPTGPGWANPDTSDFVDVRIIGRDGRRYGPLPRDWAHYKGMYYHGQRVIVSYTVGNTPVLEMPGLAGLETDVVKRAKEKPPGQVLYTRTFNIGPRDKDMILQIARHPSSAAQLNLVKAGDKNSHTVAVLGAFSGDDAGAKSGKLAFDGKAYLEVDGAKEFQMRDADFTIFARIRTKQGGTIFCKTKPGDRWVPDGKTLFVRGGRLCYDIGWVGVVQSRGKVNDGRWHNVALTYRHKTGQVQLFIDGKPDGRGKLQPNEQVANHVLRIGYTAPNFPRPKTFFDGELASIGFYDKALSEAKIAKLDGAELPAQGLLAAWNLQNVSGKVVKDATKNKHDARVVRGASTTTTTNRTIVAGLSTDLQGAKWLSGKQGELRLKIPAGKQPLKFTLWTAGVDKKVDVAALTATAQTIDGQTDLAPLTKGGPSRWPEVLKTKPIVGNSDGPFAVDVLTPPTNNPWLVQTRLTGFDFYDDGNRMVVCSWDGDVWLVRGVDDLQGELTWRRIASGLFQPLGLKIVEGKIYVNCRDQIVILHDTNGDGETDFYENFNNDHQVTEHFHEFAMGLQTDAEGNFYYAKSARHALKAIVPHHGTLLRVSKDGSKTDILATGFRAANGVCLNPDGSFIVTDQEGHWNPKNRINWVRPGGFYGNMFGYHDVTDSSDSAMQQPLCWITNSFDRSPAELLWVESKQWGPLQGQLLNLSYGYGKVYVVPHEELDGQMQGGMCELPIPQMPTGLIRGRFHPSNGQLYTCGMFAWAGSQTQGGGMYRIRYTGKPVFLPIGLKAKRNGMAITFAGKLDAISATKPENYFVKTWSLKRTASYGSKHYNERALKISAATLSADGKTVFLEMPDIQPTWCMEIKYSIQGAGGQRVKGTIHNTIHRLGE